MSLAAVMPLPEGGMPEISFAGVLGGHRIPFVKRGGMLPMPAESDFVISGTIEPDAVKPEDLSVIMWGGITALCMTSL